MDTEKTINFETWDSFDYWINKGLLIDSCEEQTRYIFGE